MTKTIKIPKNRIAVPADFGAMLESHSVCGVTLSYLEQSFIQTGKKITVFDAYSSAVKFTPFNKEFSVGAYPFSLSCKTDKGERVAYCGLRFGDGKPVKWELLPYGDGLGKLTVDPDAASVPISSGVCCIADAEAYEAYHSHLKDDMHPLAGLIVLDGQTHTNIDLFGKQYAVFSTGWGDGRYKCFVGYDEAGKASRLLLDFGMIEYPETDNELVEVEVNDDGKNTYVYDPEKSEGENKIAMWTQALDAAKDPAARLAALSRRGYSYHAIGDLDKALADYMAAVEECKAVKGRNELLRAWSVFDNAAEIYIARGDYDTAIKLMQAALEVGDDFYSGAYARLINLYLATKRPDEAVATAELLVKARPDDPVSHMKYAEVCATVGSYEEAVKQYGMLVNKYKLTEHIFDEASCLIELKKYDEAIKSLDRYPNKESSEQYWYYKAYIDFKNRRFTEALENAQKALEAESEYLPALYMLIEVESLMQEYGEVARYAEEYKKIRPDHEFGYNICAEAHLVLGNYKESSRNYCHLYDNIKKNDKYAALAAITAGRTGERSISKVMLKTLKHKKSPYYYGAAYAVYFTKSTGKKDSKLEKILLKLGADDDFILQIAVYLAGTGAYIPATRLIDSLSKKDNPPFEVIAQQIRLSERINDYKHFRSFLTYYIKKFLGDEMPDKDKFTIADRFISDKAAHGEWLYSLTSLVRAPKGEKPQGLNIPEPVAEATDGADEKQLPEIDSTLLEEVKKQLQREKNKKR